jgi:hypothetical protein
MYRYFFSWNINQYNINVRRVLDWKNDKNNKSKTKVRYFLYIRGEKPEHICIQEGNVYNMRSLRVVKTSVSKMEL